ncbi:hypothetical protein AKJ16_DCAP20785, partial [Drosera capensis]
IKGGKQGEEGQFNVVVLGKTELCLAVSKRYIGVNLMRTAVLFGSDVGFSGLYEELIG